MTLLEYHNNPELQKSHAPRRKDGMGYILKHFSESKFILWTEPEKAEMLLPVNLSRVITPLRGGKVEQTIPTPKPHDNRPEYMRAIEMRAMRRAMDIVNNREFRSKSETYGVNIRGSHEEASVEDLSKIYGEQSIDSHKIVDHWF